MNGLINSPVFARLVFLMTLRLFSLLLVLGSAILIGISIIKLFPSSGTSDTSVEFVYNSSTSFDEIALDGFVEKCSRNLM